MTCLQLDSTHSRYVSHPHIIPGSNIVVFYPINSEEFYVDSSRTIDLDEVPQPLLRKRALPATCYSFHFSFFAHEMVSFGITDHYKMPVVQGGYINSHGNKRPLIVCLLVTLLNEHYLFLVRQCNHI